MAWPRRPFATPAGRLLRARPVSLLLALPVPDLDMTAPVQESLMAARMRARREPVLVFPVSCQSVPLLAGIDKHSQLRYNDSMDQFSGIFAGKSMWSDGPHRVCR
jgi:hypothetical protein